MMEGLFLKMLNMSITASWLIAAVMILRLLFRKAPKNMFCILWALVALRLICPFSIESVFSLIPKSQAVSLEMVSPQIPTIDNGYVSSESVVNHKVTTDSIEKVTTSMDPMQIVIFVITIVWIIGGIGFLVYAIISYLKLHKKVREGIYVEENIWICDHIDTPFILGVIKPRIFLPSDMKQEQKGYVLAHEKAHIKRHDYLWKPLGFLLLAVYWPNPLMWAAFILFCKDIELACDEKVVRNYGAQDKKDYSTALLECSISHSSVSACPLAFGETGVKERVKFILNYKKPAFWIILMGIVAGLAVAICFMTNPKEVSIDSDKIDATEELNKHVETAEQKESQIEGNQSVLGNAKYRQIVEKAVSDWANAFVGRDGDTIVALASETLVTNLKERELLFGSENQYSFGLSSPWPVDEQNDKLIYTIEGNEAQIYYYAWTSDPHVAVWMETLSFEIVDDQCVFTEETLMYHNAIASDEEYLQAYPDGIDRTRMDYSGGSEGEVLNNNALLSSSNLYKDLFEPESAVRVLLNLLDNPNKVKIERSGLGEDGSVNLRITFAEDGKEELIRMIQPYGESGIWIPRNYFLGPLDRFMQITWDQIESRNLTMEPQITNVDDIICIGEIPKQQIKLYGYNDKEYFGEGVAIQIKDDVNYFDWYYLSPRTLYPDVYWDEEPRRLQVALKIYTGTGLAAQELHVLDYFDTGTLVDNVLDMDRFRTLIDDRIDYEFDEETKKLKILDKHSNSELVEINVLEEGKVIGLDVSSIYDFALGSKIQVRVEVGYIMEDSVMAFYNNAPSLEAEVLLSYDENGEMLFNFGDFKVAQMD